MKLIILLFFYVCASFGKTALLIIDVQYCFFSNGTLPVTNGERVVPVINRIRDQHESSFDAVVLSQDWHCPDHVSFASQFAQHKPQDKVDLTYNHKTQLCSHKDYLGDWSVNCSNTAYSLKQTLWPDHCIRNTHDSALSMLLRRQPSDIIIHKGWQCDLDAYSAFYNNGHIRKTELDSILKERSISTLFLVGLAYDVCVYYSALDAASLGYKVFVIQDATQCKAFLLSLLTAIDIAQDSREKATKDMNSKGINIIQSKYLSNYL